MIIIIIIILTLIQIITIIHILLIHHHQQLLPLHLQLHQLLLPASGPSSPLQFKGIKSLVFKSTRLFNNKNPPPQYIQQLIKKHNITNQQIQQQIIQIGQGCTDTNIGIDYIQDKRLNNIKVRPQLWDKMLNTLQAQQKVQQQLQQNRQPATPTISPPTNSSSTGTSSQIIDTDMDDIDNAINNQRHMPHIHSRVDAVQQRLSSTITFKKTKKKVRENKQVYDHMHEDGQTDNETADTPARVYADNYDNDDDNDDDDDDEDNYDNDEDEY